MEQQYGTVIQEQGDLGLGLYPINESQDEQQKEDKEDKK